MAASRAQTPGIGLPRMAALPRPKPFSEAQGADSVEGAVRRAPEDQREAEWQTGQTALHRRAPVEVAGFAAPRR
jgi:hypothetical protein